MMPCKEGSSGMDSGKYVRYTSEQVEALERLYHECPKPSSMRRQQLIRECSILSNVESKQIKVWFQNRRCREKQRKEGLRLQVVNRKLTAMNKLLMEENERLQKQVSQLVFENSYFRQQSPNDTITIRDTSCDSAVTSSQLHLMPQDHPRDSSSVGLISIAEETLTEFLKKATGTSVKWVQMPGMKPGPDSIGIISISRSCSGVAARACGLVGLEATKIAEVLKDRLSWFHDCRSVDVVNVLPTGNNGKIELLYMQLYAPTTLAPARDFWLLRYTSSYLEDGSLVVCERSLNTRQGGLSLPAMQPFVRAEMFSSGYLIRPCEGGGSVVHIVDHVDLEPWSVPEVIQPVYESSTILAQRMTMAALRYLRQITHEANHSTVNGWGRQPSALRGLRQRLTRGFNEALNGFADDGWSMVGSDGMDDVTILVNSSPSRITVNSDFTNIFPPLNNSVLCAKASMLLQDTSPAMLLSFLREHRSEWADSNMDAYSAAACKANSHASPVSCFRAIDGQVILPAAHALDHEVILEVLKLESVGQCQDALMPLDPFLLQLCSGVDENSVGNYSELIFAPTDASFSDDTPLLPSGFRIIPLHSTVDSSSSCRTLDLASALEVGPTATMSSDDHCGHFSTSVIMIALQFAFESHLQENVASMARQYIRSIISSVQRVALALSSSRPSRDFLFASPGSPEAVTLASWICKSYRVHFGVELFKHNIEGSESLKLLWHHSDAVFCCSVKAMAIFKFANQAGLNMLETTPVALQDITLEKIFDDSGRNRLCTEVPHIIQKGFACIQGGLCVSSTGRPVSYEKALAWKVLNDEGDAHCICFMFVNWSFV